MYYYFSPTLPYLQFDAPPPFTEERFAELCREHLKPDDREAFEALRTGKESSHHFVREWQDFEVKFRNAAVKFRNVKSGADARKWLRSQKGESLEIENAVGKAFAETDPMKRDTALKRVMWDNADELAGNDIFKAARLFAFFIHLQILAERAKTNAEAGRKRLLQHVDNP